MCKTKAYEIGLLPQRDGRVFVSVAGIHPDNPHLPLFGPEPCGSLNAALFAIGLAIGTEMDRKGIKAPALDGAPEGNMARVLEAFQIDTKRLGFGDDE